MRRSLDIVPTPKNASWVVRKILDIRTNIVSHQNLQGGLQTRLAQIVNGRAFSIKESLHIVDATLS